MCRPQELGGHGPRWAAAPRWGGLILSLQLLGVWSLFLLNTSQWKKPWNKIIHHHKPSLFTVIFNWHFTDFFSVDYAFCLRMDCFVNTLIFIAEWNALNMKNNRSTSHKQRQKNVINEQSNKWNVIMSIWGKLSRMV